MQLKYSSDHGFASEYRIVLASGPELNLHHGSWEIHYSGDISSNINNKFEISYKYLTNLLCTFFYYKYLI